MTTEVVSAPHPASAQDLAILRHPDRKTTWVQVVAATLSEPIPGLAELCGDHLQEINDRAPIVGARLHDEIWIPGEPSRTIEVSGDPLDAPQLLKPFALSSEPPVRTLVSADGWRIALAVHHAALDGRGMVTLIHALIGGPLPEPEVEVANPFPTAGRSSGSLMALSRVLRPADRVPPSPVPPARDSLAVRRLHPADRFVVMVPRIAAAAIEAIAERSEALGWPWRRIGLTIPVGGAITGLANLATYRRVDLRRGESVRQAISRAVKAGPMPIELTRSPRSLRFLSPIADRFSDSLLVSNHGLYDLPGIAELDVFPVARGRSAVSFGAATVEGGVSTIALRARDLTREDAEDLLDLTIRRLEGRHD
jgi:hypothetical protein